MNNKTKIYEFLFCLSRASELVGEMTASQLREAKKLASSDERKDQNPFANLEHLQNALNNESNDIGDKYYSEPLGRRRQSENFEDFSLPRVMQKVRTLVLHNANQKGVSEIEWLLRILLLSPKLFRSTRELENFLKNITGIVHTTKSTGRDRIVDWYFRNLRSFPQEARDFIIMNLAQHIFISLPSNYSEWHSLLYEDTD